MAADHTPALNMLASGFRFTLPGETQVVYNRVLGEYNQEAVRGAVVYLLRNSKRFPSIAELLDVIEAGHGKRESMGESEDVKLAERIYTELGFDALGAMSDRDVAERYAEDFHRLYPHSNLKAMGALSWLDALVQKEREKRCRAAADLIPQ